MVTVSNIDGSRSLSSFPSQEKTQERYVQSNPEKRIDSKATEAKMISAFYDKLYVSCDKRQEKVSRCTMNVTELELKFLPFLIYGVTDISAGNELKVLSGYDEKINKLFYCSSTAAVRLPNSKTMVDRLEGRELEDLITAGEKTSHSILNNACRIISCVSNIGNCEDNERRAIEQLNSGYIDELSRYEFKKNYACIASNGSIYTPDAIGKCRESGEFIGVEIKTKADSTSFTASANKQMANGIQATMLRKIFCVGVEMQVCYRSDNNDHLYFPPGTNYEEMYMKAYPEDYTVLKNRHTSKIDQKVHLSRSHMRRTLKKEGDICRISIVSSVTRPLKDVLANKVAMSLACMGDIRSVLVHIGTMGLEYMRKQYLPDVKCLQQALDSFALVSSAGFLPGFPTDIGFTEEGAVNFCRMLRSRYNAVLEDANADVNYGVPRVLVDVMHGKKATATEQVDELIVRLLKHPDDARDEKFFALYTNVREKMTSREDEKTSLKDSVESNCMDIDDKSEAAAAKFNEVKCIYQRK